MIHNILEEWLTEAHLEAGAPEKLKATFQAAKPFHFIQIPHFLKLEITQKLVFMLMTEEFEHKKSDLFSFHQTRDFQQTDNLLLEELRGFISSDAFIEYMEKVTGLEFAKGKLDIHGTLYEHYDYLLCHDDQLEGRKLAFMLYTTDLDEEEGGQLAMYDAEHGKPKSIVKKIRPVFNEFVCFEVTPESFHEVEELVSDRKRLAIAGWLHGR